jgi:16S rRNA (guanine527-N7)-methyltransferase
MKDKLLAVLQKGLIDLKLNISVEQKTKLIDYIFLLQKWNKVYNLTAIDDSLEMMTKHILDSLAINAFLPSGRILDVGCGAGLPCVPLAIINPQTQFVGLDSQQKKINFVLQAILTLKISNLSAVCSRIELFGQEEEFSEFDGVVSRAFASLADFVSLTTRFVKSSGFLYAMKAKVLPEELAALPYGCTIEKVHRIQVPGLDAERSLVIVETHSN